MVSLNVLRPLTTAVLGALACAGCYSSTELRLQVRAPAQAQTDAHRCVRTADRVFADAGFERVRTIVGPDMFYTPRTNPGAQIALGWGIGAWLDRDPASESCAVTIEAISADPAPTHLRPFTTQRGEPFDAAVREMAKRLELAFEAQR